MSNDLALDALNTLWIDGLWKGMVWEKNPRLFYLGMHDQWYTFNMFGSQAWLARDIILGKVKVPSPSEMSADDQKWKQLESEIKDDYDSIRFQGKYTHEL